MISHNRLGAVSKRKAIKMVSGISRQNENAARKRYFSSIHGCFYGFLTSKSMIFRHLSPTFALHPSLVGLLYFNNDFLHVKKILYVLVYLMYLYLRFSLTSTTFYDPHGSKMISMSGITFQIWETLLGVHEFSIFFSF